MQCCGRGPGVGVEDGVGMFLMLLFSTLLKSTLVWYARRARCLKLPLAELGIGIESLVLARVVDTSHLISLPDSSSLLLFARPTRNFSLLAGISRATCEQRNAHSHVALPRSADTTQAPLFTTHHIYRVDTIRHGLIQHRRELVLPGGHAWCFRTGSTATTRYRRSQLTAARRG